MSAFACAYPGEQLIDINAAAGAGDDFWGHGGLFAQVGAGGGHEGAEVVFEVFVVNGHGGWCFPLKIFWL